MNLFELYAKLVLDTSEYEAGVNNAESMGATLAASFERGVQSARNAQAAVEGLGASQQAQGASADSLAQANAATATSADGLSSSADGLSNSTDGLSESMDNLLSVTGEVTQSASLFTPVLTSIQTGAGAVSRGLATASAAVSALSTTLGQQTGILPAVSNGLQAISNAAGRLAGSRTSFSALNGAIDEQAARVKELREKYMDAYLANGKFSRAAIEAAAELQRESTALQQNRDRMADAKEAANNFDETAEDLTDSVKEEGDEAEKAADKNSKFGDVLKGGLLAGAKAAAAGLAAAAGGVVALTKSAVESYASYEQLKGGVETLFGAGGKSIEEYAESVNKPVEKVQAEYAALEQAQSTVMANAANAYETVGMSANDYMETVTGFAASLTNSLGGDTVTAAEKADRALRDMSDNANKMGTDMESIKNAYSGFAKQNYTMLDNLKLGYGGTKEEMQRLLTEAEQISGIKYDLSSYADIVDAIHVVQEEMGITGTTENEAATTIQGSVNATKAAWQNLLTGLADESADFPSLISNVVDSASTAFNNLAPRVLTALNGVSQLVAQIVPIIVEQIPPIIEGIAPNLFEAVSGLFSGALEALLSAVPALLPVALTLVSDLASYLVSALPQMLSAGGGIILTLVSGIASAVPTLMEQLNEVINRLIPMLSDPTFINEIIQAGFDILTDLILGINQALPALIVAATDILLNLCLALTDPANLMNLINAAIDMCFALADGLLAALPVIVAKAPILVQNLVDALAEGLPELLFKGIELIGALIEGLVQQLPEIVKAGGDIIVMLINGCVDLIGDLFGIGEDVVQEIKDGISAAWDGLVSWFSGIWDSLFGNRKVSVDVEGNASGSSADGSHANGLSYVPYDGYIAELHRGEMVVPAGQAQRLRTGYDDETAVLLKQILYAIEDSNGKETVLKINNREFGRAVRGVVYA